MAVWSGQGYNPAMLDDLFIRQFDPGRDMQSFVELNFQTFLDSIPAGEGVTAEAFRPMHADLMKRYAPHDPNRSIVHVAASQDHSYLGHCWFTLQSDFFTQQHIPWILDLSVAPQWRGNGVGKFLLEDCKHRCRMLGFQTLGLQVFEHNPGGVRFYEREGFSLKARSLTLRLSSVPK